MIETLASPAGWGSPFLQGLFLISIGIFMVCLGVFIWLISKAQQLKSK